MHLMGDLDLCRQPRSTDILLQSGDEQQSRRYRSEVIHEVYQPGGGIGTKSQQISRLLGLGDEKGEPFCIFWKLWLVWKR